MTRQDGSRADGARARDLGADAAVDERGDTVVRGRRYRDETFESLVVPTPPGTRLVLDDVTFERCRTRSGFFFTSASVLRDVTFVDLDCGDALHIGARTHLEDVTVAGARPAMLWIRPYPTDPGDGVLEPALNIARYTGQVSITGVRTGGIVLDPAAHVVVRRALLDDVDWTGLGLGRACFWRLMARKVAADGAAEGIVSVPTNDDRAVRDLDVLRDRGYLA
jgi:hypothetical protein